MVYPDAMSRRRYSDDDRANALAALAANGGNVERTATQLGIPQSTLRHWVDGDRHPEALQMGEQKKGPLADTLEVVAFALAGDLADPARRAGAKVPDLALALAIVIDKMRLLREQATSLTGTLSDVERAARLRALVEEFRRENGTLRPHADGAGAALAAPPGAPDVGTGEGP
jgi:hypothetical protein